MNDHPKIMGIINVSPESFYRNSIFTDSNSISKRAKELELLGADIVDIGAMSTAPYLDTIIQEDKEIERLGMAISAVRNSCSLPISVDTCRAKVAQACIDLGIDLVNDISGLKHDDMMTSIVSNSKLPIILSAYAKELVLKFGGIHETLMLIKKSISMAIEGGISKNNIIVDPSIGFFRKEGKNLFFSKITDCEWYERDLEIISNLAKLSVLSKPICISLSNKSFIGHVLNLDINDRVVPSTILEVLCFLNGAKIIRTHNVRETKLALNMIQIVEKYHPQDI